jgi:hypothetical protein
MTAAEDARMADDLDRAIAEVSNRGATWVSRRDAADYLGRVAAQAREALKQNAEDPDTDVRAAVARALGDAAWRDAGRAGRESQLTLEELVRAIEKPGKREVQVIGGGFEIAVTLKNGRTQKVCATHGTSEAGADTIRVCSRCGPAAEQEMAWALRTNNRLPHCSLAIVEDGGREWFDLVHSLRAQKATVDEFRACVKEVAFYADWAEARLTKGDVF